MTNNNNNIMSMPIINKELHDSISRRLYLLEMQKNYPQEIQKATNDIIGYIQKYGVGQEAIKEKK